MPPVRSRRLFLGLLACCLLPGAAIARTPGYILPQQLDLAALLAPPPSPDSAAQAADLARVLAAQAARTPAEAEFAVADARVSVFRFADVLGSSFSEQQLPLTKALFKELGREVGAVGRGAKDHWQRPRPYLASTEVRPLLPRSTDGSYPSSHSMFGYLTGLLLGQLIPEQREALIARGIRYGDSRVVAGVHYPTDVAAGRMAATAMAAVLLQNPRFLSDLAAVRQEIRGALKLP